MRRITHYDRQRLERAAEHYLHACYRGRTAARASELAQFIGVARTYLSRVGRQMLGMPVSDFLRRRQLAHAADLLRATPLGNKEIAKVSAFGSYSAFHRCFLAEYGQTPAAYRAQST